MEEKKILLGLLLPLYYKSTPTEERGGAKKKEDDVESRVIRLNQFVFFILNDVMSIRFDKRKENALTGYSCCSAAASKKRLVTFPVRL